MGTTEAFGVFGLSFVVAVATIPVLKRIAVRHNWVDDAGGDPLKIHQKPTPFIGGLGMVWGCLMTVLAFGVIQSEARPIVFMVIGLAAAGLGFLDDVSELRPTTRLIAQIFISATLGIIGIAVGLFRPESVSLSPDVAATLLIVFVTFYVVGAMNAVNMQDGLDGLAGGLVLISCIGSAVVARGQSDGTVLALALALSGAVFGFLVYNFHPASVFMGDNGSYFLGYSVAALSLSLSLQAVSIANIIGGVLLVGAPVFDAALAIIRRLRRGVSPLAGDRGHFYDFLSQRGFSVRQVALISYALQTVFVASGVILLR